MLAWGVAVALVLLAIWSSFWSRKQQLRDNEIDTYSLAQTLAGHADALLKQADVVLLGIVERIEVDGTDPARVERLRRLLISQKIQLPQLHGLFVYDEEGRWLVNSNGPAPAGANNADRSYFAYHRDHIDKHARMGAPLRSRSTGEWVIPVSRRIDYPDGKFAGVVLATVQLNYLRDLYESIDKGINGVISLVLSDGTVMLRSPFSDADIGTSVAQGSFFRRYQEEPVAGSATAISTFDRIERIAGYRALDNYPLVIFVARDKHEVLAQWRRELAMTSGVLALMLTLLGLQGVRLLRLLKRQLRIERALRRTKQNLVAANQRLSVLAQNDGLTGLTNRRAFDLSLQNEIKRAVRTGSSLGVLMIDIDYFKQYNDYYGHPAGDVCLQRVAGIIKDAIDRQGDVAARYGGEEFALILPGADLAGVFTVADRIRCAVFGSQFDHAGSSIGVVTISVGATAGVPTLASQPPHYVAIADGALYTAKATGRNKVIVKPFNF